VLSQLFCLLYSIRTILIILYVLTLVRYTRVILLIVFPTQLATTKAIVVIIIIANINLSVSFIF